MKFRNYSLAFLSLALTACVVTVDSDYKSGAHWDEYDIRQIEIGETRKDWILAAIGIPNNKHTRRDGTEVWRYKNVSERDTKVGVFLLLHFNVERERHKNLYIEFKDDVVTDYSLENDWVE